MPRFTVAATIRQREFDALLTVDAADIIITVRDPGPGFDLALADPDRYTATGSSHGRGICLMRSLMTDVNFAHGGCEVQLRKHFGSR